MFEVIKMHVRRARGLWADRKGISALEYAVLAVGILGAVAAGAVLVGDQVTIVFGDIVKDITPG